MDANSKSTLAGASSSSMTSNSVSGRPKKTRDGLRIHDEDTYTEALSRIIERDFFPDLRRLRARVRYLEARDRGDVEEMRAALMEGSSLGDQIAIVNTRTGEKTPILRTGSTPTRALTSVDTPRVEAGSGGETPLSFASSASHSDESLSTNVQNTTLIGDSGRGDNIDTMIRGRTLDDFCSRNTSEDNAAFQEIMKKKQEELQKKRAYVSREEDRMHRRKLEHRMLDGIRRDMIEGRAISDSDAALYERLSKNTSLEHPEYTGKSSLMFVPDGESSSLSEGSSTKAITGQTGGSSTSISLMGPPKTILRKNTRLPKSVARKMEEEPIEPEPTSLDKVWRNDRIFDNKILGKRSDPDHYDLDDLREFSKEVQKFQDSLNTVGGFSFVSATPSPMPGVDGDELIVTWGDISGTPLALDGSDTTGPSFSLPPTPQRDVAKHDLVENLKRKKRKEEEANRFHSTAVLQKAASTSHTPSRVPMSPVAAQLASKMSKRHPNMDLDMQLRASYSTPISTPARGSRTPGMTPQTSKRTPAFAAGARMLTPARPQSGDADMDSYMAATTDSSKKKDITDNLLKL